ncbi:hypothetical protein VPH35_028679 [Triticum aestivum]
MVPEHLHAYELKQRKKTLRFESDSKEYAEKEKRRRTADGAKGAKFGKLKQPALQKERQSSIAEEGGTPRRIPCVACVNKNLGKRTIEASAEDPQRKRPHVSEGPNSDDDDFVHANFVRYVQIGRRKDYGPSKS